MDARPSLGESRVLCLRGPVGVGGREDRAEGCAVGGWPLVESIPFSLARSRRGALGVGRRGSVGGSFVRLLACGPWGGSRDGVEGFEVELESR